MFYADRFNKQTGSDARSMFFFKFNNDWFPLYNDQQPLKITVSDREVVSLM
jgi:hypothetical protein